jgi:hypothetical protein
MSEKPISLLRLHMTEDTPAAGGFYPEQTMDHSTRSAADD